MESITLFSIASIPTSFHSVEVLLKENMNRIAVIAGQGIFGSRNKTVTWHLENSTYRERFFQNLQPASGRLSSLVPTGCEVL